MEPKKFLNTIFGGDKEFERHHNNMDNLIKFMRDFDNPQFGFIEANKRYLGFNNGVLDVETGIFIPELECSSLYMVKQYLDIEFSGETDTPYFDSIFDFQLADNPQKQEIKEFIYFCLGRLFGIRDKYDFTLYLMGEAGCGKSLVIDVMKQFFRDIGAVSSNLEKVFGLASLYDKDLIVCDDLPKNFSNVLPQTIFQTWISGGELSIAFKGGSAKTVKWNAPLLFAGNYNPDYVDKGQISRRVMTFEFSKIVSDKKKDTGLLRKISKFELDKLALKCIQTYNKYINDPSLMEKSIWSVCPEYFRENQEELKKDRNPLYAFLSEHSVYCEGNIVALKDIKEAFEDSKGIKVRQLDNGTFIQVDDRYEIKYQKICKHCSNEGVKGCCTNYKSTDRISTRIVKHIKLI
jgi:phage/plasmid-associated DNA primase